MLTETYGGCKIKVRAGRKADFGRMFATLNGEAVPCYENRDEHKALESIKRLVDEVNSQPVDGGRWAASYYAPGTYEMCPEGMHPQAIGGECTHPCCVERRGGPRAWSGV